MIILLAVVACAVLAGVLEGRNHWQMRQMRRRP